MQLSSAIDDIVEAGIPAARKFGTAIHAQWVDDALRETGTVSVRGRRRSLRASGPHPP